MAHQFLAADLTVVAGGFHISGCISMLPELPPDIQEAQDMGVILYSGEADRRVSGRKALRLERIGIVKSCPR